MDIENEVAINGDEQTPAPISPPPLEEAVPTTAREAVRRAYEQERSKAADREEKARPAAPAEGEDPGKPPLDRTRDPQGRFVKGEAQDTAPPEKAAPEAPEATAPPKEEIAAPGGPLKPPPGWNAAA